MWSLSQEYVILHVAPCNHVISLPTLLSVLNNLKDLRYFANWTRVKLFLVQNF